MNYRINDEIKENTLRVIDQFGEFLGVFSRQDAMKMAKDETKDLIQINNAEPPVCKIQEVGKFLYQQKKNQVKQKKPVVKEIKLRPTTDLHDMKVKAEHVNRFLDEGGTVTIKLEMRGREQNNMEHAKTTFSTFMSLVKEHKVIFPMSHDSKNLIIQIKGV